MPNKIEWVENLNTGLDIVDRQHRKFFALVNKLLGTEEKEGSREKTVVQAFDFLKRYIIAHLGVEETLMDEYKYDAIPDHKAAHHHFRSELDKLRRKYVSGGTAAVSMPLSYLVVEWFGEHIQKKDKRLVAFLQETAKKQRGLFRRIRDIAKEMFSSLSEE